MIKGQLTDRQLTLLGYSLKLWIGKCFIFKRCRDFGLYNCKCQVLCLDHVHNIHWKNVIMNPYGYIYKGGTYG